MLYFNAIPNILTSDGKGNNIILKNLMIRSEIMPTLLKNPLVFYSYDIQEGDTPEIIAHKYYGDSYRYWIILFANQIMDPQWNWPLTNNQFQKYIYEKYIADATEQSMDIRVYLNTVKEYRKTIKTIDHNSNNESIKVMIIDAASYANTAPITSTYTLPNSLVTRTISKEQISIYDYETEQNESKRKINLINSVYVSQMEQQFKTLMSK